MLVHLAGIIETMGRVAASSGSRVKAQWFRSYVSVLVEERKRDAVMALVPPDTAALISDPPLAASWLELRHISAVICAVEKLGGMSAVRDHARRVTEQSRAPYMGIVEGVLRLFGTSPATLFKRMNTLVSNFIQGVDFTYAPTSERSGVLQVEYPDDGEVPLCVFVGQTFAFQTLLDACDVKGVVAPPERRGPNKASYNINW
jgi:hypothetical protein